MATFDYVIVGAGPTGLTLAYILGSLGKTCLLLDSASSIGGCHRVVRVDGLFTEHAPRIYSESYKNTIALLNTMQRGIFSHLFTTYKFSISNIGGQSLSQFTMTEIFYLGFEFLKLTVNSDHGKSTSMDDFMNRYNFSQTSRDYVDRLCRLTDGGGSDVYSLYEFLQLINQQAFYKLLQPRYPNDVGLFRIWKQALDATNLVTIRLETRVNRLLLHPKTKAINGILVAGSNIPLSGNKYILAISPQAIVALLGRCDPIVQSTFLPFNQLVKWSQKNTYINDIGVTFHWNRKLRLRDVWGFPKSEWGLAFIVLSDYMNFNDTRSMTVITTCITRVDARSTWLGKSANQCNRNEMINEIYRQLSLSFPDLPPPTSSLLNPSVKRIGNQWIDTDSAYIATSANQPLKWNGVVPNLYNVGTQNDKSHYKFTSFESAVSNALEFCDHIEPLSPHNFKSQRLITLIDIIRLILLVIVIVVIVIVVRGNTYPYILKNLSKTLSKLSQNLTDLLR
jgi:hypothetical protein